MAPNKTAAGNETDKFVSYNKIVTLKCDYMYNLHMVERNRKNKTKPSK